MRNAGRSYQNYHNFINAHLLIQYVSSLTKPGKNYQNPNGLSQNNLFTYSLIIMDKEIATLDSFDDPAPTSSGSGMKEIRLSSALSSTQVPNGNFYSVEYDDDNKEDQKDLGKKLKVVVLRHAMTVGAWDEKTVYSSSEFRSFQALVVLFDHTGEKPTIAALLPYTTKVAGLKCIKDFKETFNLKVGWLAYVLFNDEVYRLRLTASDNVGADEDYKPMFENPDEKSFTGAKEACYKDTPSKTFMHEMVVSVAEKVVKKKTVYLKQFKVTGPVDEARHEGITTQLKDLYGYLASMTKNKLVRAEENTGNLDPSMVLNMELMNEIKENPLNLLMNPSQYVAIQPAVVDAKALKGPLKDGKTSRGGKVAEKDKDAAEAIEKATVVKYESDIKVEDLPF